MRPMYIYSGSSLCSEPVVAHGSVSGEAGAGDSWTGVVRCPAPFTRVGSANLKCRAGQVQSIWANLVPLISETPL